MRDETTMDESRPSAETIADQLSALMDGELPDAQARFLQRRLAAEPELRAKWARMQVAASCLRNQPWRPVSADLADRVAAALAVEPAAPKRGRRIAGWAVAASVAALALAFVPRFAGPPAATVAAVSTTPTPAVATLASADLVAARADANDASAPAPVSPVDATGGGAAMAPTLLAQAGRFPSVAQESPLPAVSDSPADFPLVHTGDKHWPRSTLAGSDDPAMEALLVRHNQMLANDGLSGFVPYVDVVATDTPAADGANAADDADADGAASSQGSPAQ